MRIVFVLCLVVCSGLAFVDEAGLVGPQCDPAAVLLPGPATTDLNWETMQPLPEARRSMASAAASDLIYHIGGFTSARVATNEAYDPAGDSWQTRAPMPTPRNAAAAATVNGKVYVVGGYDGASRLTTVEEYDPAGDSWHVCPPMTWARTVPAAAGFDGKLYCIGGFDGVAYPTTVERYDPALGTWDTVAPLPTGRGGLATAVLGGRIYAIGGWVGTEPTLTTVECYDPEINMWTTLPGIGLGRMYHSAAALGGHVFTIGGQLTFNGPQTDVVEAYDTTISQWSYSTPMLIPRGSLGVAATDAAIYAAGGWTGSSALDQNDRAEVASGVNGPDLLPSPGKEACPGTAIMTRAAFGRWLEGLGCGNVAVYGSDGQRVDAARASDGIYYLAVPGHPVRKLILAR